MVPLLKPELDLSKLYDVFQIHEEIKIIKDHDPDSLYSNEGPNDL